MSAHDPLCTALDPARLLPRFCDCERVAKIREAIARQIEAAASGYCCDYECVHAESHMAVSRAADIVRGEV